jgi:hypothetical protein
LEWGRRAATGGRGREDEVEGGNGKGNLQRLFWFCVVQFYSFTPALCPVFETKPGVLPHPRPRLLIMRLGGVSDGIFFDFGVTMY